MSIGVFLGSLASRGLDFASLGAAYLVLLATVLLTTCAFIAARHYLVISPNRWTRDHGVYVSWLLATLLIATLLENETLPHGNATTHYAAVPQLLLLLGLNAWIWKRQEPWLVALGAAAGAATIIVTVALAFATKLVGAAYVVTALVLSALLVLLWLKAVSTKSQFLHADTIYIASKEMLGAVVAAQKPWLGLPQWAALIAASVGLAVGNSLLRGAALEQIPATEVAGQSLILLGVTAVVGAVPAATYWLLRKSWMPELTRLVWLAWMVIGFAFTYGNYLTARA
ncbi:MAG: hypothetical protein ABI640_07545 [Gammaproteobacteria bacterium]